MLTFSHPISTSRPHCPNPFLEKRPHCPNLCIRLSVFLQRPMGTRGIRKHRTQVSTFPRGNQQWAGLSLMFSFPLLLRTLFFLLLDRHQAPNLNTCIGIYHQINNTSNGKRKEHLRTIGMRGIRNARVQCSLMLEEKLEHSHSFMFPFLLLLGPLFLPLPCSQSLKD